LAMPHSRGNQYEYGRFKLVLPRSFRKAFLMHGSIGFQPVFRARPTGKICYTAGVPGSDGASPYRLRRTPARTEPRPSGCGEPRLGRSLALPGTMERQTIMSERPPAAEYLVISRGQWDRNLSRDSRWDMAMVSNGGASFAIVFGSTVTTAGFPSSMKISSSPGWKGCGDRLFC
jgi:hypothetical protein